MKCDFCSWVVLLSSAATILFTAGCAEKNKTMSTTSRNNPAATAAVEERAPVNSSPPAAANQVKADSVSVINRYAGQIILGSPGIEAAPAGRVILDQTGYQALLAALPERRIQMKQPAPPSDDPLLKRPEIDFTRHMLVVAVRRSMFHGPKISRVSLLRGRELTVEILLVSPDGIMPMASRDDVGTYEAVVVPRAEEKAAFRVVKKTMKDSEELLSPVRDWVRDSEILR